MVDHRSRYLRIESYQCPVCGTALWGYYEWETERWLVVHGEPDFKQRPNEAHIVVFDLRNNTFMSQDEQREATEQWCRELHVYKSNAPSESEGQ